ncbi:MAG TPA: phosphate-starvation-inducible PsiE family protein [Acidobacteriaceae bacterium]|nr:phosphate-starvation-inducible PsiE family protein [Acidobacteriaceae bacterium]
MPVTSAKPDAATRTRHFVRSGLTAVEDLVYIGLGVVLAATAIYLLVIAIRSFVTALIAHALSGQVIGLLDQILLILLVVELLYTVQVSFREHALVAEPFLVVALIATVRKILVLTAQFSSLAESSEAVFRHSIAELSLLAVMVLVLVGSLILLHRNPQIAGFSRLDG